MIDIIETNSDNFSVLAKKDKLKTSIFLLNL